MLEHVQVLPPLADVPEDRHPVVRPRTAAGDGHDLHLEGELGAVLPEREDLALESLADGEGPPSPRPSRRGATPGADRECRPGTSAFDRPVSFRNPSLVNVMRGRDGVAPRGEDHHALDRVVDRRLENQERLGHAAALGDDRGEGGGRQRHDGRDRTASGGEIDSDRAVRTARMPRSVPQIATAESNAFAVTVSRTPKRNAIATSKGRHRNSERKIRAEPDRARRRRGARQRGRPREAGRRPISFRPRRGGGLEPDQQAAARRAARPTRRRATRSARSAEVRPTTRGRRGRGWRRRSSR